MPYVKGTSGNLAGRPRGSRNRSTLAMREVMAQLIDDNLDLMSEWLSRIAADDPKAAFQCVLNLLEFNMPKISRITWPDEPKNEDAHEQSSNADPDDYLSAILEAVKKERG